MKKPQIASTYVTVDKKQRGASNQGKLKKSAKHSKVQSIVTHDGAATSVTQVTTQAMSPKNIERKPKKGKKQSVDQKGKENDSG